VRVREPLCLLECGARLLIEQAEEFFFLHEAPARD